VAAPESLAFWPYYALNSAKGSVQILSIVLSATADVVEPGARAGVFSVLLAAMATGMVVAAGVGGMLSLAAAANTAVVATLAVGALTVAIVPGARPPRVCAWRVVLVMAALAVSRVRASRHAAHRAADAL
jgi:hypothetical protein